MKRIAWAAALLPVLAVLAGCGGGSKESEGLDTSFNPPASYSLQQLDQKRYPCGKENERCAISYLDKLTTKYGPQASLGVLNTLETADKIDPTFDTHQLAHLVGEATAKRFGANKQAFGLCPQTFNYGCVHGFFIYVLGRSASPTKAARMICDSGGQGPLVPTFNCWHGVGHGVMMARGNDLQASLDVCDSLGTGSAADGCWQGVFMENVNAVFRDQARPGVFSPAHPLRPCTRMLDAYKQECFINQAGWLAHLANDNIGKAARFCLDAGKFVSACAQSIGLMVTNPSWQLPFYGPPKGASFAQIAWDLCSRFPTQLQRDCVLGGVDNLANFDQLDVKRSDAFCALTGRVQNTCYLEIGVNLIRRTTDVAVAQGALQGAQQPQPGLHRRHHARPGSHSADQGAERETGAAAGRSDRQGKRDRAHDRPGLLAAGPEDRAGPDGRVRQRQQRGLLARVRPASDPHRLSGLRRAEEHPPGPVLEVHLQPPRPLRVPQPPEPGDPRRSGYFEGLVAEAEPLRHSESSPAGENFTQAACRSAAVE